VFFPVDSRESPYGHAVIAVDGEDDLGDDLGAAVVAMAILPTILIDFYFTPQNNETFIQTAITDNLAGAMEYSVSHQNNFKGYQPTLLNEAPKCSGLLTENISPDGTQVAVFGRSRTNPAVYYCSTLAFSMASLGSDNNFGQSMQTVPAQFVSAQKYDCSPSNTSPATVMPVTPITQPVSIMPPLESSAPISTSVIDAYNKAQRELIDFEAVADQYKKSNGSYAGFCTSNQFNIPTLEKQFTPFEFICNDSPTVYATQISIPGHENEINWCYDGTYYGTAQPLTGLQCVK